MELQAVIVKKPIPFEEAHLMSKEYIDDSKNYYRETKTSYRFRNIPKSRFDRDSFRTKKINNQVTLVLGKVIYPF